MTTLPTHKGKTQYEVQRETLEFATPKWLPIETAPKDGTGILAWSREFGVRETHWSLYGKGSAAHVKFLIDRMTNGSWYWHEPQSHWVSSWEPTHYMPLPAAPTHEETNHG